EELGEKGFDLVFTSMTFHHLKEPVKAIDTLKGYLKKGGYIVIVDLYKEDGTFHSDNTDVVHFGFDQEEVNNWLKETGLKKIDYRIVHKIKKVREGKEREYPVFMVVGQKV
ncbi:MAG: class I SAM-dependent methyltransferase, partial [Aquificae bacterium]|nr:class I SAM-dependent methyltransferase [Aquificota bacterium]